MIYLSGGRWPLTWSVSYCSTNPIPQRGFDSQINSIVWVDLSFVERSYRTQNTAQIFCPAEGAGEDTEDENDVPMGCHDGVVADNGGIWWKAGEGGTETGWYVGGTVLATMVEEQREQPLEDRGWPALGTCVGACSGHSLLRALIQSASCAPRSYSSRDTFWYILSWSSWFLDSYWHTLLKSWQNCGKVVGFSTEDLSVEIVLEQNFVRMLPQYQWAYSNNFWRKSRGTCGDILLLVIN